MSKKKLGAIALIILAVVAVFVLIYFKAPEAAEETDALKFKKEYESYNETQTTNGENTYLPLNIKEKNPIVYKTGEEIIALADEGESFVVLFGFATCPWCRAALPALLEASTKTGINEIYYLDILEIRDTKILNADKEVETTKEGTTEYLNLLDRFSNVLSTYEGLEDEEIKRIYSPTVMFVHNGTADSIHLSTVESHEDPFTALNEEQYNELLAIYEEKIQGVLSCPNVGC